MSTGDFRLNERDAAALDALVEAGFDCGSVGEEHGQAAERLAALLALLEVHGVEADPALRDVVCARIARGAIPSAPIPELSPDDAEALDAWVLAGYHAQRVPASLRERAQRHEALAGLVTSGPAVAADGVINATLDRIQREADRKADRMRIDQRRIASGIRLGDLISVAAVLMIAAAVLWPMMTAVREQSRRAMCRSNFGEAAVAFASYAGANRDSLPLATASLGQGPWWNVGREPEHSNSANLFVLPRERYLAVSDLACPGNPYAASDLDLSRSDWPSQEVVSYSYQNLFTPFRPTWSGDGRAVVLVDRSPVVQLALRGQRVNPFMNSANHGGKGQHVLYNDGTCEWIRTPVLKNGDNIWLPNEIEQIIRNLIGQGRVAPLKGTEQPGGPNDAFVVP